MGRGLLSRIEDRAGSKIRPSQDIGKMLAEHLRVLFNTHRGDAATDPSFGLVDFTDLFLSLPRSLPAIQASIRSTLMAYEPRLKNIEVRHLSDREPPDLHFEITAQLAETNERGTLHFRTEVHSGGRVDVWS